MLETAQVWSAIECIIKLYINHSVAHFTRPRNKQAVAWTNLTMSCGVKEARSKRIHTMWLHLREAQKWVKEIHTMTSQDNSYYIVITSGEMGDLDVSVCVCVYMSDSATLWTLAHQAPLSMGFSRQEYWSRLPCPPPGDLPNPGMKPVLLCLLHWQVGSLPLVPPGKPKYIYIYI